MQSVYGAVCIDSIHLRFTITVPIDRSFVNFIFGYLSTGLSNMGVSFDYQQGFSAILSQFPVSYPEIKFTIFSNRADV